ncbi:MAG: TolB family protein [Planctomycetota bacterium]
MHRTLRFLIGGTVLAGTVFIGITRAQTTARASVGRFGLQGNAVSTNYTEIGGFASSDGRLVVFSSLASNLVTGDTNAATDAFVRDFVNGVTTRVSVDSSGVQGNGTSNHAAISADGRFVAFVSSASNLVPGDTNGAADLFIRDRQTSQTARIVFDPAGTQQSVIPVNPSLSADGRYVVFTSSASFLVPGDTNTRDDIFVHDRQTATFTRVSVDSAGSQANDTSYAPAISGDGNVVSFSSRATNVVAGDTNGRDDVFAHDRTTGVTTRVNVSSGGAESNGAGERSSLSHDGRYVAFEDAASSLVGGDTNSATDVFVHDRVTAQTVRISLDSSGAQGNGNSTYPSLSADGLTVAFGSLASNLVGGDTNGRSDVFVRDLLTSQTTRVSVDGLGAQGNETSRDPRVSADGFTVVFTSDANNLVAEDTNAVPDVFAHDIQGVDPFSEFCFGDGSLATPCPCALPDTVPNPSGASGHGCANSFNLDGALLYAEGGTSPDTVVFTAFIGPGYVGFGFLVKGDARSPAGFANGDGVRCVSGALVRFGGHNAGLGGAAPGHWTYPNVTQSSAVSVATAQAPAQDAWYQLFYRNAVAGFCSSGTTNWTNGVRMSWP